jgi:hypothetical protein
VFSRNIAVFALVMLGAPLTLSVKFCVTGEPTPLLAVKTSGNDPVCVGVPARRRVPGVNVTPDGSEPVTVTVGAGNPLSVTRKLPAALGANVVLLALVNSGGSSTVNVKFWTMLPATPLLNVKVMA